MLAVAATGRTALDAVNEHGPDVAVLDLSMPDGDGLWVCAELQRAREHHAGADPDHGRGGRERAGRAAGRGHGYAVKGAGPDEIAAAVARGRAR